MNVQRRYAPTSGHFDPESVARFARIRKFALSDKFALPTNIYIAKILLIDGITCQAKF